MLSPQDRQSQERKWPPLCSLRQPSTKSLQYLHHLHPKVRSSMLVQAWLLVTMRRWHRSLCQALFLGTKLMLWTQVCDSCHILALQSFERYMSPSWELISGVAWAVLPLYHDRLGPGFIIMHFLTFIAHFIMFIAHSSFWQSFQQKSSRLLLLTPMCHTPHSRGQQR